MDVLRIETALMLHGDARHCDDCTTTTVFLPVEDDAWVCTACDAAVLLPPSFSRAA